MLAAALPRKTETKRRRSTGVNAYEPARGMSPPELEPAFGRFRWFQRTMMQRTPLYDGLRMGTQQGLREFLTVALGNMSANVIQARGATVEIMGIAGQKMHQSLGHQLFSELTRVSAEYT